ncbi:MAG: BMP family ABC transporter substrate-binding protein [Clostridium sp.]|nr:BMP family ABC transporter substrate-binding protein [Clostridium sp.]
MNKRLVALAMSGLMVTGLAGCGTTVEVDSMKVGMVTNTGLLEDKSFSQGTWEGIQQAMESLNVDGTYMLPAGETEADYATEIANLYDSNYKFIITPGYKFETAIYAAQSKYKDAKFVILDGEPNDGEGNLLVGENTAAIYFAEEQSGFIAGIAAALEVKEGDFGFIGGLEIPAVKRFEVGYRQGIEYANKNLGTNISLKDQNVVYEGTFTNVAGGQQLSAQMYDSGVKVVFVAAGSVGIGAMNEAKSRVALGEEAWVIGVDSDQYHEGLTNQGKSVVLTSAIKMLDEAAYQMIEAELNGKFPGGQTLTFDATNDGIGIPAENPNLSEDTIKKVSEVYQLLKSGEITVKSE